MENKVKKEENFVPQDAWDEMYLEREEGKNLRMEQKSEKFFQLDTQRNSLKFKINELNKKFKESITNPQVDTVNIVIEIEAVKKRLEITEKIIAKFFPQGMPEVLDLLVA